MTPTSLFALVLAGAPAAEAQPPAPTVTAAATAENAEYRRALENVETTIAATNEDPAFAASQLKDALHQLQQYAVDLANDPDGQRTRTMGMLTLARALLALEDARGAREAMDEAIRTARGDPLPTKQFGPGLAALQKEREGVLAKQGTGAIAVACNSPCRVYINERPSPLEGVDGLFPGKYRVLIVSEDGSPNTRMNVEIAASGQVTNVTHGERKPDDGDDGDPYARIMPVWAEATLIATGAVAVGVGGALIGIAGTCPGGADPNDPDACPQVYTTLEAGIGTLAVGGALLLTGTITLTVDQVRLKKHRNAADDGGDVTGTQAMVTWTYRF